MLLLLSSFILVVLYTVYYCIFIGQKKHVISIAVGKCVSMALGMVSSTMIGLLVALLLPGELAYSTILSILLSAVFACIVGSYFGLTGVIESLSATFMGAMMGAMLGDMIADNRQVFILMAMDIIYVLAVLSLMLVLNNQGEKGSKDKPKIIKSLLFPLVASLSIIGIVAALDSSNRETNDVPHVEHVHEH